MEIPVETKATNDEEREAIVSDETDEERAARRQCAVCQRRRCERGRLRYSNDLLVSLSAQQDNERVSAPKGKLMRGCACLDSQKRPSGFGHLSCFVEEAENQKHWDSSKLTANRWTTCATCRHPFTGQLKLGLARARWKACAPKKTSGAQELQEELKAESEIVQRARLNAGMHLANALQENELLGGAVAMYRKVLKLSTALLGDEHPKSLVCVNHLAMGLMEMGDYSTAIPLLRKDCEVSRRVYGRADEHPACLAAVNNLGAALVEMDCLDEAEPLCLESLKACEKTLGAGHPNTILAMHSLGSLLLRRAAQQKSTKMLTHKEAAAKAAYLLDEAEKMLSDAADNCSRELGKAHPDTVYFHGKLGAVHTLRGAYASAQELLEQSIDSLHRHGAALGGDDATGRELQKLALMHDLATLHAMCAFDPNYTHSGTTFRDTDKALSASVLRRALNGETLPPTLSEARTELLDRAESLLGEIVEGRTELLGALHPETLRSQAQLRYGITPHIFIHCHTNTLAIGNQLRTLSCNGMYLHTYTPVPK